MDRVEASERIAAGRATLRAHGWTREQIENLLDGLHREDAVEAIERAVARGGVTVRVHGTNDVNASADTDGQIGSAMARHGFPVAVHITRNNTRQTVHLSFAEATQLHDALAAARKGE